MQDSGIGDIPSLLWYHPYVHTCIQ